MSSLTHLPDLVGFFSYSREDDQVSMGRLSALRNAIQRELRGLLGRTQANFRVWQDETAISQGTLWEQEITGCIEQAVFFIPIVTPRALKSQHCVFEFKTFLVREAQLGRGDLIFPILYIPVPELKDELSWPQDPILKIVGKRQYYDWRDFPPHGLDDPEAQKKISHFCLNISNALNRPWMAPQERQQMEEAVRMEYEGQARRQVEEAARKKQMEEAARKKYEGQKPHRTAEIKEARTQEQRQRQDADAREMEARERTEAKQHALAEKRVDPQTDRVPRRLPSAKAEKSRTIHDSIEFGVSFPPEIKTLNALIIEAWLFQRADRENTLDRANNKRPHYSFSDGGAASITRGARIVIRLKIPSCSVEPASQTVTWDGAITNASFIVRLPESFPGTILIGMCSFSVNGLRIGQVPFEMTVAATQQERQPIHAVGVKQAFVSYASKDRRRVLGRVQGIQKLPIKVFMDVRDLHANDPYPSELLKQIDSSDVLYLFWSQHARRSPWVKREWRYGMERKGLEFIDPVPLVDPRKVAPPPELADTKHFNDWTLAYIEYEKALSAWDRFRSWVAGD
jgi:TIR domain